MFREAAGDTGASGGGPSAPLRARWRRRPCGWDIWIETLTANYSGPFLGEGHVVTIKEARDAAAAAQCLHEGREEPGAGAPRDAGQRAANGATACTSQGASNEADLVLTREHSSIASLSQERVPSLFNHLRDSLLDGGVVDTLSPGSSGVVKR